MTLLLVDHECCVKHDVLLCVCVFEKKVGDFGDATNWPTPGEIATKEVQVSLDRK